MTLADSSASIEAKFWDVKPHDVEVCQTGKVIQVTGDSLDYKGVLQLRVNKVESVGSEFCGSDTICGKQFH